MSETAVSTGKRGMDEVEQDLSDSIYQALMDASNYSERSKQAKGFRAGISDLGYCSERLRRMLARQTADDRDVLAAFIGTAIGDHAERAIKAMWPEAVVQASLSLELKGDQYTYELPGHPDLILPWMGMVLDCKTDFGLADPERNGPNQQQQWQRHNYGLAAWQAGYFGDLPLEEVRVGNFWIDRGAVDKYVHVNVEPYNPEQTRASIEWLDEVVYNFKHDQEAMKEPPRNVCAMMCGFYDNCRALDTDVEGLIRDPRTVDMVNLHVESAQQYRDADRAKKVARQHLEGVEGSTGTHLVRWIHVNGSGDRRDYKRLEISEIPVRRPEA